MARRSAGPQRIAACALCLLLLFAGCGSGAQTRAGRRLIREYLAGRGAEITECYTELLRPDGTKPISSDFVKGSFRMDGADYELAVNTVTGEVYTSERLDELEERLVALISARLGLEPAARVASCLVELWRPSWQAGHSEWPEHRSYLGHVLPVTVSDMDAYAAQALEDENVRVLLYLTCRSDELREGRWSGDALAGWRDVEIELFGFAADESLPSPETFPHDYHYAADRPRLTLRAEGTGN